ncbi:hypothetical protein DFH06DRAFT_1150918 [Mycena polygramma]|nr:hypothetical protein DFH06DRAFT_1150918 [Mycena polygramma]
MPALQAPASSPIASPMSSVALGGITLAGHIFTAAQVRIFLRGAGLLAGFFLFSYLALVTVPKLALRSRPRAERDTSTPTAPEHPFSTRPPALTARAYPGPAPSLTRAQGHRRATITSAAKTRSPSPPPLYREYPTPAPHQVQALAVAPALAPFSPPIWAALTHLHRTADALVGAHPACPSKLPLRAPASALGSYAHPNSQAHLPNGPEARRHERFPWVSPTLVFGLVRPHLAPGKTRTPPRVAKIFPVESSTLKTKVVEGKKSGSKSKRRRPFSLGMFNAVQKSGNGNAVEWNFKNVDSVNVEGKNVIAKGSAGMENVPPRILTSAR